MRLLGIGFCRSGSMRLAIYIYKIAIGKYKDRYLPEIVVRHAKTVSEFMERYRG